MPVINTNINSLVSQHALVRNGRELSAAMEQLSTGRRINSAADDAAGLAISSRMTAQLKGMDQAVRNANDGISILQTTEGALIEMTNMLHRMRELAIQASNDTYTPADRGYLDLEYQQLMQEIARTTSDTQWNGMNLLNNSDVGTAAGNGSVRQVMFQVGANANQLVSIEFKDFSFDTGAAAVPSKDLVDFASVDLSTATSIVFKVGTQAFTVPVAAGALSATATPAQVATVAGLMRDAVQATPGFENVQFNVAGTSLEIWDPARRAVSGFDALADTTSLAAGSALTSITAGSVAVQGANPTNTNAIFRGDARLNDTGIATRDQAFTAVARLEFAVDAINRQRAAMGAVMNRLTYAADNLTNTSQNINESRSRIQDADYAKAASELARTQIIQQAATAVLAQANTSQQAVLKLLGS